MQRTAYEAAIDAAHDGIIYLELRAGPMTHMSPELPVEKAIEAMLLGLQQAESETGTVCRLIVAALRNHSVAENLCLAKVAGEFVNEGVVEFDLAGLVSLFIEIQKIQEMALEAAFISDKALRERLYRQICAIG